MKMVLSQIFFSMNTFYKIKKIIITIIMVIAVISIVRKVKKQY